jgi:hypothetical protein
MTLYADPSFYAKEYLENRPAVIEPSCVTSYLRKAQMIIKNHTFDNIDESADIPYEVKMCQCEIAELLYSDDKRATSLSGVSSESVEGWSKHYESSEQIEAQLKKKIKSCVTMWLAPLGLLYCGVTV